MTNKQLLSRLARAQWCCADCGENYGKIPKGHLSTWSEGKCDICKKKTGVTQVRDYGYFYKFATNLKKEVDKEAKKKIKVKKSQKIGKLWKDVGIALQDYYRSLGLTCCVCHEKQQVMHHNAHWGTYKSLRLQANNLIPLCHSCHCSWHQNSKLEDKLAMEKFMKMTYGQQWEEDLICLSNNYEKMPASVERDFLLAKIEYYNNLKNDKASN